MSRGKNFKKYREIYVKFKGVIKLALLAMLYIYPQTAVVAGICWFVTWSLGNQVKRIILKKTNKQEKAHNKVKNVGYTRVSEVTIPAPLLGVGVIAGAASAYFGYHNHFDSIIQGTVLGMLVKVVAIPFASVIVVSDGASNLFTGRNSNIADTYRNLAQDVANKVATMIHQNSHTVELKTESAVDLKHNKIQDTRQINRDAKDQVNTILNSADITFSDKTHKPSSLKKKEHISEIKR